MSTHVADLPQSKSLSTVLISSTKAVATRDIVRSARTTALSTASTPPPADSRITGKIPATSTTAGPTASSWGAWRTRFRWSCSPSRSSDGAGWPGTPEPATPLIVTHTAESSPPSSRGRPAAAAAPRPGSDGAAVRPHFFADGAPSAVWVPAGFIPAPAPALIRLLRGQSTPLITPIPFI